MPVLPIFLAAIGIMVVVFILVALLFPLILAKSPLGDVVLQAEINDTVQKLNQTEAVLLDVLGTTGVESFNDLFQDPGSLKAETMAETVDRHTKAATALLRGVESEEFPFAEGVAVHLSEREVPVDAWGNPFRYYLGPWSVNPFGELEEPPFLSYYAANLEPNLDGTAPPTDIKIFVYSLGRDGVSSQPFAPAGNDTIAGDDVGAWVR